MRAGDWVKIIFEDRFQCFCRSRSRVALGTFIVETQDAGANTQSFTFHHVDVLGRAVLAWHDLQLPALYCGRVCRCPGRTRNGNRKKSHERCPVWARIPPSPWPNLLLTRPAAVTSSTGRTALPSTKFWHRFARNRPEFGGAASGRPGRRPARGSCGGGVTGRRACPCSRPPGAPFSRPGSPRRCSFAGGPTAWAARKYSLPRGIDRPASRPVP